VAVIVAVAAVVVALDQWSKTWAEHALRTGARHVLGPAEFVLEYNSGAAFSTGTGVTPIVEAVVVALVVVLLLVSRRASRRASLPAAVAMGMLLGGALGNLGDRLFRHIADSPGAVVDFIRAVGWWPVFNVADASIVVGAILAVLTWRSRD
jgi:signal peptidase II